MAPQRIEKIESGPGNGMVSEASNPQDVVHGRAANRPRVRSTSRENDEAAIQQGKFSASQALEIAQNRERISETSSPRLAKPYQPISPDSTRVEVEGKFSASQPVEITRNRETISETLPPRSSPPRSYGEGSRVGLFGPADEALQVSGSGARPTSSPPRESGEGRSAEKSKENFPPRNPLKSHKTGKSPLYHRHRRNSRASPLHSSPDRLSSPPGTSRPSRDRRTRSG